jgi:DNA-binding IclR family transcriptional regulator
MLERSDRGLGAVRRRGIRSVETGLRVLAALAASGGPTSLTALGARSGLSPSQTHRYLQSLVAAGMAVQDASARYDLGPAVIRIGIAGLARLSGFARAEVAMAQFVEETGWTALLAVWGEVGPVCVRWIPGRPPTIASFGVGSVLPLCSAVGQVFLALLGHDETDAPLAAVGDAAPSPQALDALRRRVRAERTVHQDPNTANGLQMIAAPIFDLQGRPLLVAGAIAGLHHPNRETGPVTGRLREACRTATLESGGAWAAD